MNTTIPVDIERARRVVHGLRHGHCGHVLGCPRGCPLTYHEDECTIGRELDGDDRVDYDESPVWVPADGTVRLTHLREVRRWSQ
jgi:hypothetical protein